MRAMMNRAVVFLVLVGSVVCEELNVTTSNEEPLAPATTSVEPDRTSTVLVENKVQNVTVNHRNSTLKQNTSIAGTIPPAVNISPGIPLTNTSKILELPHKPVNDSLAVASSVETSVSIVPSVPLYPIPPRTKGNDLKKDLVRFHSQYGRKTDPSARKVTNYVKKPTAPRNPTLPKTSTQVNITNQFIVEKKEVKEMRLFEDRKDNNKYRFYIVAEENSTSSNSNSTNSIKPAVVSKKLNGTSAKAAVKSEHKDSNGQLKPYLHHRVPPRYAPFPSIEMKPTVSSTPTPVVYTFRPDTHNTSYSIPAYKQKKINVTSLNVPKKDSHLLPARDFSCLRCVGSTAAPKQYKHSSNPIKPDPMEVESHRPGNLQGLDDDTVLSGSQHHFVVAKPDPPAAPNNTSTRHRLFKNSIKNYLLNKEPGRRPFISKDSVGSYTTNTGGPIEFPNTPSTVGITADTFTTTQLHSDKSDLYHLDDLSQVHPPPSGGHIKYETKEIHIPYPVTVEKRVSYPIHIKVDRPVPIHIDQPYPVHVEKKVPVPVKVHVPQPYPVEKEVPYAVKIPIEVPRPVQVPKPVPYLIEKPVPIQVIKQVKVPVKIPVDIPVPYKVPVHVEKRVPYFVEKKVPFEIPVPVEKPHLVEIKKPFEVPVEKPYAVTVERKIPVPVQMVEFVKMPVAVQIPHDQHNIYRSNEFRPSQEVQTARMGVITSANTAQLTRTFRTRADLRRRPVNGRSDQDISSTGRKEQIEFPIHLPQMISVEFPRPEAGEGPTVTSSSDYSVPPMTPDPSPST